MRLKLVLRCCCTSGPRDVKSREHGLDNASHFKVNEIKSWDNVYWDVCQSCPRTVLKGEHEMTELYNFIEIILQKI
jgi:hypothetical protein